MTLYRRPVALGVVDGSWNEPFGHQCVDVFQRTNGTFGFELYRRDGESSEGWFPIGFFSDRVYADYETALNAAIAEVSWLESAVIA